ncbi:Cadherin-16 [Trichinella spiralis]|uniref:Cadherin-16 n=1 Tax=Trichinella spiralis TaxID=6334 RepID=A0ABR3KSP3_TRISP
MLKRTRLGIVLDSLGGSEEYCTFLVIGHCLSGDSEKIQKRATFAVESFSRTEKWRLAESRPFCRRALSSNKLTRVRRLIQSFRDHLSSGHGPYFTAGDGITAQRFSWVFGSGAFSTATLPLLIFFIYVRSELIDATS